MYMAVYGSANVRYCRYCHQLHSAQRCTAQHCTAPSVVAQCPALHCIANIAQRSVLAAVSPSQEKPSAAASGGTAQEHCQCSNDSKRFRRCTRLHVLSAFRIYSAQRYASAATTRNASEAAHIQRAALHSAPQRPALRCAVRSIIQPPPPPPALHSAQHCTAPSKALHPAQRAKTRPIAASEPSRLRKGGLLRFLCSISAHENRSADTRGRSLCLRMLSSIFGALGIPAKPNRDVPRMNALLCFLIFYLTILQKPSSPRV